MVIAHVYTATAAIALGAIFGVFQGFARASAITAPAWFDYYRILTMHGVLMALAFYDLLHHGLVAVRHLPEHYARAAALDGLVRLGADASGYGDGRCDDRQRKCNRALHFLRAAQG